MTTDFDMMLLIHVLQIDWQSRATPHEFEVHLPLVIIECSHDSPEAFDDRGFFTAARDSCDRLELVNVNSLHSARTALDLLPVHKLQNRDQLLLVDTFDAFSHSLNLLFRLVESGL